MARWICQTSIIRRKASAEGRRQTYKHILKTYVSEVRALFPDEADMYIVLYVCMCFLSVWFCRRGTWFWNGIFWGGLVL